MVDLHPVLNSSDLYDTVHPTTSGYNKLADAWLPAVTNVIAPKGTSPPATVSITINSINDAPVANAKSVSVNEDSSIAITLTGTDVDGSSLTFSKVNPSHGTLTGTAPNLTYTPAANYFGQDSFNFTVSDEALSSASETVSITVNPVNDAPVATAQSVSVNEDDSVAITLTGTDVEGANLTFTKVNPSHGTLAGTAPNLTYTPAANYSGPDSFTFTVNDGVLTSAPATVSITVNPVNDTPVAIAQSVSVNEDDSVAITLTGTDVEGANLTFTKVNPSHGTLAGTAPNLTYTPAANYNGPDSFTFTVNDGVLTSAPATVSITVAPVNDAPVANPQDVTTDEDTAVPVILTGNDVDGQSLTFTVGFPGHGALSGTAPNLTYTPAANYNGQDSFTFTVTDGVLTSEPTTVSITVAPVNDEPVATAQDVTTDEDTAVPVILTGNDVDGQSLTFTVGSPGHGALSGTAPDLIYTPAPNYNGLDSFTFTVTDGVLSSEPTNVSITVNPVNDAPVATPKHLSVDEDHVLATTLAGGDIESDTLTFEVTGLPAHGTVILTGALAIYTPAPDYNGADSFTFTVSDGTSSSTPASGFHRCKSAG